MTKVPNPQTNNYHDNWATKSTTKFDEITYTNLLSKCQKYDHHKQKHQHSVINLSKIIARFGSLLLKMGKLKTTIRSHASNTSAHSLAIFHSQSRFFPHGTRVLYASFLFPLLSSVSQFSCYFSTLFIAKISINYIISFSIPLNCTLLNCGSLSVLCDRRTISATKKRNWNSFS